MDKNIFFIGLFDFELTFDKHILKGVINYAMISLSAAGTYTLAGLLFFI